MLNCVVTCVPVCLCVDVCARVCDDVLDDVVQLRAATSPDVLGRMQTGANFIPLAIEWPYPTVACNETLQDLLWEFTEQLIDASTRKQA